jgi:3-deoxy-7-phosphoheptulonate synthase
MFKKIKTIPTAEELRRSVPFGENLKQIKSARDAELCKIIAGQSDKFLLIVGPCSADNMDSVCDYVSRLARVGEKVRDKLFIVPRIYTNKPRTKGDGYKGIFSSPVPDQTPDISEGIISLRKMHVKAISESGLTSADEMLYPQNYAYVDDLLSYVTIGARSSENQEHRLVASGIDTPVGIKNPMAGSLSVLLNSVYAAQLPQIFMYHGNQAQTGGNPYAHTVLRGYVDNYGNNIPNYHYEDVFKLIEGYKKTELKNQAVIIDTSHSNSNKQFGAQIRVANEIINNIALFKEMKKFVKGLMIESYIAEGSQPVGGKTYGQSITDGCIGWEDTEKLIYSICERI